MIVVAIIISGGLNLVNEMRLIDLGGSGPPHIVEIRFGVFFVGVGAAWIAFKALSPATLDNTIMIYGVFCIIIAQYINAFHPNYTEMGPVSIILTVLMIYLFVPAAFPLVAGLAIYATFSLWFAWAVWRDPPPPPDNAFRMVLTLLVVNLAGLITANSRNRNDRVLFAQNQAMAREVTGHKRTAEELRRQKTQLLEARQRAEKALATELATVDEYRKFISIITHEFRNPLAIIRGHTQLAQRRTGLGEPEIQPSLQAIKRAVERLQSLFDRWLEGGGVPEQALLPVPETLRLEDLFLHLERQVGGPESFTLALERPEPELVVEADLSLLLLALLNLIDNAGKYAPPGRRVSVSAGREGNRILLRVHDQGHGIAPDDARRVFEPGYRGARTDTAGSGFGLYLVEKIVQAHGGEVTLTSEVGAGSVFTLSLPAPPP